MNAHSACAVGCAMLGFGIVQRLLRSWPACLGALVLACSVYEEPSSGEALGGSSSGAGGSGSPNTNGGMGASNVSAGTDAGGKAPGTAGNAGSSVGGGGAAASNGGVGASAGSGVEPSAGSGDGGSPSVVDECPDDLTKLAPGKCGCGIPDKSTATMTDCVVLKAKLAHRYDFEGSGTSVKDRIGTAHGSIARSATLSKLDGKGVVLLGGGSGGPYVDLPNGLLSSLPNASLEAWVTWGGGDPWQRIFDFGDSTYVPPENNPDNGKSYLYVTPKTAGNFALLGYSTDGNSNGQETQVKGSSALPLSLAQVVVVADAAGDKLKLYINGVKAAEQAWTGNLAAINDVNVWLGRSQYGGDPELSAVFHEFRVYGAALTDADVTTSYVAGPDPAFLAY